MKRMARMFLAFDCSRGKHCLLFFAIQAIAHTIEGQRCDKYKQTWVSLKPARPGPSRHASVCSFG